MKRASFGLTLCATLFFGGGFLRAQAGFDDNFLDDPLASGDWIFNGVATWVPAPGEAAECLDDNVFDPLLPCSVYNEDEVEVDLGESLEDFGGYVLVTPATGDQAGNAFRATPDSYENFKLEIVVELRDGSIGGAGPADGMVVVIVGGDTDGDGAADTPPDHTGTGGGGMGAPCVGATNDQPMLSFEFDDWNCNNGDNNNRNHVAFSYSGNGFPCTDAIQPDVKVDIPENLADLHTEEAQPASPNRFKMTVFAQNCGGLLTVAMDLEALDQGVDLGRVFTHVVPNFEPFEGYLGVTASTGGAWQNHILHSATLTVLPEDFCLQPGGGANRSVVSVAVPGGGTRTPEGNCGDYLPGDVVTVGLTLENVREANECCAAAGEVIVRDTPPDGWPVSNISDNGTFDQLAGQVVWTIPAAQVTEGKVVTYDLTAQDSIGRTVSFGLGNVTENVVGGLSVAVSGASVLSKDEQYDACGGITCWNILGGFAQPGGAGPGVDQMRLDYLTDGVVGELEFVFEPGAEISPDFFGASASSGLIDPGGRNPGLPDTATVFAHNDTDSFINLNDDVFSGDPNNVMAYAQAYIFAEEEMDLLMGFSSDDSIQVILNEEEVHINSIPRGGADACTPQDPAIPVTLVEGENRLLIKVFEGGGGWNFAARFEDDLGNAITEGIEVSKLPTPGCRVPPARGLRAVAAASSVRIGAQERKAWNELGEELGVEVSLADIRAAGADCTAAGMVTLTETVPAGWIPSNPSNGGVVNGETISWNLNLAGGPTSVSYTVETAGELLPGRFSGSISEPGSPFSYGVRGDVQVEYAPRPFGLGQASVVIDDDFDEHTVEAECPDGWTCNGQGAGFFPFTPGVTQEVGHEGRLRLTNEDGNLGTTVIWNDPIDIAGQALRVEADVFITSTGISPDPADGLTVMFLDAENFLSSNTSLGGAGGGIGYSGLTGFAVEFDTWQNNAQEPSGYNNNADREFGHIGLIRDGIVTPHVQTHVDVDPLLIPTAFAGNGWPSFIDFAGSGFPLHVEIEYNNGHVDAWLSAPETVDQLGAVEAEFPRTKVLDTIALFPESSGELPVLQSVFFGFSAGTGGAVEIQEVDNVVVTVIEASDVPQEICDNGADDDGDGATDCADDDCAAAPNCQGVNFVRGDADSSGVINLTDGIRILGFLFLGTAAPTCMDAADADDSGGDNPALTDAIFIFNWLFIGGPPPRSPSPSTAAYVAADCGQDTTDDALDCAQTAELCQ